MNVIEISDKNIDEMIKSNKKVIIDCYASWCGPCKMLSPIIDELAEETEDVKFYKINTDNNTETTNKYKVMTIPTLLFFENGELKQKSIGFKTKEEIKKLM